LLAKVTEDRDQGIFNEGPITIAFPCIEQFTSRLFVIPKKDRSLWPVSPSIDLQKGSDCLYGFQGMRTVIYFDDILMLAKNRENQCSKYDR